MNTQGCWIKSIRRALSAMHGDVATQGRPGQRLLATAANAYQHGAASRHTDGPGNAAHMLHCLQRMAVRFMHALADTSGHIRSKLNNNCF